MAEHIKPSVEETTYTNQKKVWCDGPDFSKHPRVFLTMNDGTENEVVCPYCSRIYRFDEHSDPLPQAI